MIKNIEVWYNFIGCHEDNLCSYKTIINNNGVIYRNVSPFIEHVYKAYDSDNFKSNVDNLRIILVCPMRNNFNECVQRFSMIFIQK